MADLSGFYYLHVEGALIFRGFDEWREEDLNKSDLVQYYWHFHQANRADAWRICIEATVAGVHPDRVRVLTELWNIRKNDYSDANNYAEYLRIDLIKNLREGDFTASVPRTGTMGRGATKFEALVALCKRVGWRPVKGGKSFEQMIRALVDA